MLKAGVRVSDIAKYQYNHPSTIQRLRDRYQATGTVKDRRVDFELKKGLLPPPQGILQTYPILKEISSPIF